MAINNYGYAGGMLTTPAGEGHAFVTGANGAPLDLGVLPGGSWSAAYGLNDAGQAAGYGDIGGGRFRGFIWSPASGTVILPTFGGRSSYALAINGAGQAVGHTQARDGHLHAFLASGGALTDLGTLGGHASYAYGINSSGAVVGSSRTARGGDTHAFLFEDGVMFDLNTLIGGAAGWELTQAFGINNAGQIVGSGYYYGAAMAFRLDRVGAEASLAAITPIAEPVPEPAAQWLVLAGLATLALRAIARARAAYR